MDNTSFAPGNNSINNFVPPPTPQYSVPEHKHFLNKKFGITFIILILLGVGAYAGIWYWQTKQVAQQTFATPTPRVDETADWKTYMNTKYGFSVKMPSSLISSENQPAGIPQISFNLNSKTVFSATVFNDQYTVTESYGGDWKASGTLTVDGYQARELKRTTGQYSETAYLINAKNIAIHFEDSGFSGVNQQTLDKILSTFKFIDSGDMSTWKTYRNIQYGFEFKYPTNFRIYGVQETDFPCVNGSCDFSQYIKDLNKDVVETTVDKDRKEISISASSFASLQYKTIKEANSACKADGCLYGYDSQEEYINSKQKIDNAKVGDIIGSQTVVQTLNAKGLKGLLWSPQWGGWNVSFDAYSSTNNWISISLSLFGDTNKDDKSEAINDIRNKLFDQIISTFKFTK